MEFTLLSVSDFCLYEEVSACRNFFQSINMYHRYIELGYETYLVGVKRDGKVVAASLLVALGKSICGYKIFNAYKGFLLDYSDFELLEFFTKEVKNFLRKKKCIKLFIDPYIVSVERDRDGNKVRGGVNNLFVKYKLESLGYKYLGEVEQVKWTYVLEFNNRGKEEVLKNFKSNVRNYINKTNNKYVINIRKLSYGEIADFRKITSMSADKQGFVDKSLKYYQSMYDHFGDKVEYLIAELDVKKTRSNLLRLLSDSKDKDSILNELEKLDCLNSDVIPLAAGMFIYYGNEVIYLFSGNDPKYVKYYGCYALQWYVIQKAIEYNYKRYNFFGIKMDKDDGVFTFKKGFNGNVEELLGTFELKISNVCYIYDFIKKIMSTKKS